MKLNKRKKMLEFISTIIGFGFMGFLLHVVANCAADHINHK
jgi:hypothetical protein